MSGLELKGVGVRYGTGDHTQWAVDDVTLGVPHGSVLGIVGESGSGKSTLARAIVGFAPLSAGRILLDGNDLTSSGRAAKALRRRIQLIFQDPRGSLNPRMTAGEAVSEAVAVNGRLSNREVTTTSLKWFSRVGLNPALAGQLPQALSGGQRQRVAIARALAAEPDVVIADEITSALDVSVQGSVLNLIRDLQRERGFSMLFISHNLAVVRYVSDRVAVMRGGRVVEVIDAEALTSTPTHPYTRALIDAVPRLGATLPEEVQKGNSMTDTDLQTWLDEAIVRWGVPGAAVGIERAGTRTVAYAGVTSVENPLPVDEHTIFQPGSIGKTVTASAIMHLVERGLVDLDAPVRTYVPDLLLDDEAVAATVTVRHLLNHTAGWAGDRLDATTEGDDALERFVELMQTFPQVSPLGSEVSYNNASLALAGRIIERVTEQVYESAVEEIILRPLGLEHSFFHPNDIMTRRFAVGHTDRDGDGPQVARPWKLPRSANAGGGLCMTAPDLLRWARFHLGDGATEVLSVDSRELMQQPTVQTPGAGLGDAIGISWLLRDADGVRIVAHGGSTNGQHAQLTLVPERDYAFVALTNGSPGGAQLLDELNRWALGEFAEVDDAEPAPVDLHESELRRYVGRYLTPVTIAEILLRDGALVMTMDLTDAGRAHHEASGGGLPPTPPPVTLGMLPGAAHRFVALDGPVKGMKGFFASDPDGRIVALHAGGRLAAREGAASTP